MNLENMSDEEKSVMLARAMGWEVGPSPMKGLPAKFRPDADSVWNWKTNLYQEANMALAWQVLNWAAEEENGIDTSERNYPICDFVEFSSFEMLPPAEAQRAWLDKVLELAIEAGLIDV